MSWENQGLAKGEPEGNESVQGYRGDQQGWTDRKSGSSRGGQARAEVNNDGPGIPSSAGGNSDLANRDPIGNTFC